MGFNIRRKQSKVDRERIMNEREKRRIVCPFYLEIFRNDKLLREKVTLKFTKGK
jgi:hypothetical protein